MRGVERVFHVAGADVAARERRHDVRINVEGTRIVLEEALRAGVERVVHTSSVAAVGPAPRGSTADEPQVFRAGRYGLPYVNAKHEAEIEAMRIAALGLPVVVVNPAHVFGAGDVTARRPSSCGASCAGEIPAYVDGALNIVDAEDVARGHLLADERGEVGERYILGNRNFTLDRLFADLGRLSGVEPPALKLPLAAALALARAAEAGAGPPGDHHGGGAGVVAVVGVSLDEGQARARLDAPPTTRTRCRRRSTGTATASPRAWQAPGTRQPLPLRVAGLRLRTRRACWQASRPDERDRSTAAGPRPTGCARAGASLASCAERGVDTRRSACPWRRRDRAEVAGALRPAPRAAARPRRRGDLRLASGSSSTWVALVARPTLRRGARGSRDTGSTATRTAARHRRARRGSRAPRGRGRAPAAAAAPWRATT